MSFIYLAVEDELSEAVGKRIIAEYLGSEKVAQVFRRGGFGYLKSRISSFVELSRRYPVLLLTDLDREPCAPSLKRKWLGSLDEPAALLFRVAVREIEAWILADAKNFAAYLGVKEESMPSSPDALADPKRELIAIARKAKREVRLDIVPEPGARSPQGLGYNRSLCRFVENDWDIKSAAECSDSLSRVCRRLAALGN